MVKLQDRIRGDKTGDTFVSIILVEIKELLMLRRDYEESMSSQLLDFLLCKVAELPLIYPFLSVVD
jgi:hypothetical protein